MKKILIILLLLGVLVYVFAPQTLAYTLGGDKYNSNRNFPYMSRFSNGIKYQNNQSSYRNFRRNQNFNFCLDNNPWR